MDRRCLCGRDDPCHLYIASEIINFKGIAIAIREAQRQSGECIAPIRQCGTAGLRGSQSYIAGDTI